MSKRRRPQKPRRARRAPERLDPEEEALAEAVAAMVHVMTCPVLVAEEHAERIRGMAIDAESYRDLAQVARELHGGADNPLTAELGELLVDFTTTMERHRDQLVELAERFERLDDHERPHDHLEPEDIPIEALAVAMFGSPDEASDDAPF